MMETDLEDERQVLTLSNGQRIKLADYKRIKLAEYMRNKLAEYKGIKLAKYKRIHQLMRVPGQPPLQQPRDGRHTQVRSKEQQRPVQGVPRMQSQLVPQRDNNELRRGRSEQSSEPRSAKMLIFLQNGEERLITFTLPKQSCTLQEILEQVNVPFSEDTYIQCMQNTSSEIDYFVAVGCKKRIEDMLENHPIAQAAFLFLFGTTLTSGQFFPYITPYGIALTPPSKSSGCPSGPELAPLICKFMQQNIGLQFKPQLLEPSTYIAPLVVEKCDSPKLQMEIELPPPVEEMKPLVIPEAPELPPMTIPKFPVPMIIEEPPAPLHEPCESADIPEMPFVNIPIAPELPIMEIHELSHIEPYIHDEAPEIHNTVEYKSIPVPPAPELPAFVMPEIPVHIVEQELPIPAVPCLEDEPIPAPIPTYIEPIAPAYVEPLAPLPAAPELPKFIMPELPIHVVEQELPMPAAPCLEDEPFTAPIPAYVEPLASLPVAPELPAFVMPELPIRLVELESPMPAAPCLEDEPIPAPIPAYIEPVAPAYVEPLEPLPAAPELPKFIMPELPIQVVEEKRPMLAAPCLEDQPIPFVPIAAYRQPYPDLAYNMVDYEPVPVPQAPELPAFVMPELPIQVLEQALPMPAAPCLDDEPIPAHIKPLVPIPAAPELPAAPLPEFPVRVEIPSMPMIVEQPMAVPQAPELPAFVMPELPNIHIAEEIVAPAAPCLENQPIPIVSVPEYIQPLAPIPAAPELPPASFPEFPVRMEILSPPAIIEAEPCLTEEKAPEPIMVPLAPMLPEIKMPELAVRMEIEKPAPCEPSVEMPNPFYQKLFPSHITVYNEQAKETQNILLPNLMESGTYPTPCVFNLVMKHVLPNMASHNFRSMENIEIQPASFLPCS